MKLLFTFLAILSINFSSIAQTEATTVNGKKVTLNDNGTWIYQENTITEKLNPENTGIWEVRYYVDEFGDETDKGYISTKELLSGVFSNSATTNSELIANFLISDSTSVAISLYEYGSTKVKAYSDIYYDIFIKLDDGSKVTCTGIMKKQGDRIYLDNKNRLKHKTTIVHSALMTNKKLTLLIKEQDSLSQYKIIIDNTLGYENANNILHN
jgi:hypothetical protein